MNHPKIYRSFAAMFRGWIACNLAIGVWWIYWSSMESSWNQTTVGDGLVLMAYTGIVIFIAWLTVFLPTDLIVPEHSCLRIPLVAAVCGALAFPILCLVYAFGILVYLGRAGSLLSEFRESLNLKTLSFLALPMLTGLTAAFTLVRRYPRQRKIA